MRTQESVDSQREELRALLYQLEAVAGGVRHQELRQRAEALITDIRRVRARDETHGPSAAVRHPGRARVSRAS